MCKRFLLYPMLNITGCVRSDLNLVLEELDTIQERVAKLVYKTDNTSNAELCRVAASLMKIIMDHFESDAAIEAVKFFIESNKSAIVPIAWFIQNLKQ